ncbi:hypothetical protein ACQZV8_06630 [Magnetococcales bacterium HHB-1]
MKILKASVVIMGIMILVGFATLFYKMADKYSAASKAEKGTLTSPLDRPAELQGEVTSITPLERGSAVLLNVAENTQELVIFSRQGGILSRHRFIKTEETPKTNN